MAIEQEFMDAFFDINRGSGEGAIIAVSSLLRTVKDIS